MMSPARLVVSLVGTLAILFPGAAIAQPMKPAIASAASQKALVQALQKGGYVIYFRHAATDQSQAESGTVDLKNCATQRNLSKKGREQARAIGKAFAALGIKVVEAMSSPFCRCVDTAKLAFGRATVMPDLEFALGKPEPEAKRLGAVLRRLLSTRPSAGMNIAIVAHTANLKEAADIWPQPEGTAHVFEPGEDGRFVHIARIGPEEWAEIARLK